MEKKIKSVKAPNKYEKNLKHFVEFKGLNSLLDCNETVLGTESNLLNNSEFQNENKSKVTENGNQKNKKCLNSESSVKDSQVTDESKIIVSETPSKKRKLKRDNEIETVNQSSENESKKKKKKTIKNENREQKMVNDINSPEAEQSPVKKIKSKSNLESKETINENIEVTCTKKKNKEKKSKCKEEKMEVDENEVTCTKEKIKEKKSKCKEVKMEVDENEIEEMENLSKTSANEKTNFVKRHYILVENINPSVTSEHLNDYLSNNGISFNNSLVLTGSNGAASFQRPKDMEKLFNVCQGLQYKSKELFIFKSKFDNDRDDCVSNLCEKSVHIKNLDATITKEDISALISELSVENITMNFEKGTAVIDFADLDSAKQCIDILEYKTIGEKVVRASHLVKTRRPDVFVLRVLNLPPGASKNDVMSTFPCASKIKLSNKNQNQCLIHFSNSNDLEEVWSKKEEFFVKDVKVSLAQLMERKCQVVQPKTSYVLNIFNLPFDTTVPEIKEHYPNARFVEMLKNSEGMFVGSAKLMFNDKENCEEALKNSKGLTFKHRKVRAEMKIEEFVPKAK